MLNTFFQGRKNFCYGPVTNSRPLFANSCTNFVDLLRSETGANIWAERLPAEHHCWHGSPQGGKTGICPLEIAIKNQKFIENLKSATEFRWIDLILATTVYFQYYTHTAQDPGSQLWCDAVMSLQFTHVHSIPCRAVVPPPGIIWYSSGGNAEPKPQFFSMLRAATAKYCG